MSENTRGWWRRWSAKNEPPWDPDELMRWNLEAEAIRRRNRREVRPERRRLLRKATDS